MEDIRLEYNTYKYLIKEADILLFKTAKKFSFGWLITKYTHSPYSHVALAHWHDDEVRCLEFRECIGGQEVVSIPEYLEMGYKIDVFRATPTVEIPVLDMSDPNNPKNSTHYHHFTENTAAKIINTAHALVGLGYSWWTIWQLAKTYMPFIRLFQNDVYKNGAPNNTDFVCSTLISYSYRLNYIDPVSFLSDSYTTPGDLARSELFVKIFEII